MESMNAVTPQQAARAQEYAARLDNVHDELCALQRLFYESVVKPAEIYAEKVVQAAEACADPDDTPKARVKRQIATARVQLGGARQMMRILVLAGGFDELRKKISELEAWEQMAPLLDSCSD